MTLFSIYKQTSTEVIFIYTLPNENVWKGRIDSTDNPLSLRFHQVVNLKAIKDLSPSTDKKTFSIIGFECDEGVRRNRGRVGAASAPNEIRKQLSKLPYHMDAGIVDAGNVACRDTELEEAQSKLGCYVNTLLAKSYIPIIIGGGHETLYGHYLGVREFIGQDKTLGIINIDAHFDLRADETPSSGTMFRQILSEDEKAGYLCLGIQKFGNTKQLFAEASKYHCKYISEEDITQYSQTFQVIDEFSALYDYLILTLCTDSITSSVAPGVSAPSPFGLDPKTVRTLLRYIVGKDHTLSFDLSEVNPLLDVDNMTSRLGAYLLAEVMENFERRTGMATV